MDSEPVGGAVLRTIRACVWTCGLLLLTAFLLAMISPALAERLVFFPDPSDPGDPPPLAGIEGSSVTLRAADGVRLHGWWWEAAPDAPAVLFLHGNAGNVGTRIGTAEGLLERGISSFHLDYRGYGRSEGQPTEAGVYRDAEAAFARLVEEVGDPGRIVVHGRSLGGVIATHLAARTPVGGLVVESTFTSLREMAGVVYPFVPGILFHRLRGRFDALEAIRHVRAPVLVVHGTADDLIPVRMGAALHEEAPRPAGFLEVRGATHDDLPLAAGASYFDRLARFVRACT